MTNEISTVLRPIEAIEADILAQKRTIGASILYIGRALIEAKQQLSHGQWREWLETKVEFSVSSAENYMRIAREFGEGSTLLSLPYTKILALLPVPAEQREAFAAEAQVESKSVSEIKQLVQAAKEEAQRRIKAEERIEMLRGDLLREQQRAKDAEVSCSVLEKRLKAEREKPAEVVEVAPEDYRKVMSERHEMERRLIEAQDAAAKAEEARDAAIEEMAEERRLFEASPMDPTPFCDACDALLNRLYSAPKASFLFKMRRDEELEQIADKAYAVMEWARQTLDMIDSIREERGTIERVIALVR